MPNPEFVTIDYSQLARELRQAQQPQRGQRRNNPRLPATIKAIYDQINRDSSRGILLSQDNPKTVKSRRQKYATSILHFASATTARKVVMNDPQAWGVTLAQAKRLKNICPQASKGCMSTCLVGSGRGGMGGNVEQFKINKVTQARIRRQLMLTLDAEGFFTVLAIELARQYRYWITKGFKYSVRLNGTSDIDWENIPVTLSEDLTEYLSQKYKVRVSPGRHDSIIAAFPKIQFYDYTKVVKRLAKWAQGEFPPNYYLTFSLSERPLNRRIALDLLKHKAGNVSVPFNTPPTRRGKVSPLPKTLTIDGHAFEVFDADIDDLRFLDPKNHGLGKIAGLRFKLPTDVGRKQAIATTDFRLRSWPDEHPTISTRGGNVLKQKPRRSNPDRRRRNTYRGPLGLDDPAVQAAILDAASVLRRRRNNPPIAPDLIFDPHAPIPEKMSKRDRARLSDLRDAYQASLKTQKGVQITLPEHAAELLIPRIGSNKVESLYIVVLNSRSEMIDQPVMISRGDIDGTDAPVRAILRVALVSGGAGFLVAHNHPSGNLTPSQTDLAITKRLVAGGRAVDTPLMDHIIVTSSKFHSIRRQSPDVFL